MTLVHDYFNTRNLRHFQRVLDGSNDRKQQGGHGAQPSTSGGKSWNRPSPLASMGPTVDVNARDWLGRTVLHLACTAVENIEYVRALLKHPNISVNIADTESHWTPLHRAMYHANLPAAQLLLQRSDIDTSVKDYEGYTAFDLYNSTINGTKPDLRQIGAELFTWGANRNAALGLGDGNDRNHPEKVVVLGKEDPDLLKDRKLTARFTPISVREIQMSQLHTVVVTSEDIGNLRVCGFGNGGRLGSGQHTQYNLTPLPQFNYTITAVALAQDHTLALTKAGEILSWGLNRFSQLGYLLETVGGKLEEQIQATPKKIPGLLKKEIVMGIAASKIASACWTEDEVFTWGTNTGQLGYDKNAHPVQVLPRKVTKFSQPIVGLALSDNVIVGLLQTQHVECLWNDRHYRINFPIHAFPSEIRPFRPPQAIKDSYIAKVTSCGDLFAALSLNGEVFTFSPPNYGIEGQDRAPHGKDHPRSIFKPQRVWALRKKFSAVKDVALGADGSIIICTESGHVYTRIRTAKGADKNFKFQRIPYLQRVTHVCANTTGAFGALRVDFKPKKIAIQGNSISEHLGHMQPFYLPYPVADVPRGHRSHPEVPSLARTDVARPSVPALIPVDDDTYPNEEVDDLGIMKDATTLQHLIQIIQREQARVKGVDANTEYAGARLPHSADTLISIGRLQFPAHCAVLAARSTTLDDVLSGKGVSKGSGKGSISIRLEPSRRGPGLGVPKLTFLSFQGVHSLSLLILLHYIYSDEVLAIWDRRIHGMVGDQALALKVDTAKIKFELVALTDMLSLPHFSHVLQAPVKRAPTPSLSTDLSRLFDNTQGSRMGLVASAPDVLLELKDRQVWSYSVILRARSEFFSSLFEEEVWTVKRWEANGVLKVDLKHLNWHVMQYVLRFVLCGTGEELFETLPFTSSVDEVLEFMFEVMAAAAELLLDQLILMCSSVILPYLNIHNCCYILFEATYYNAYQLINSVEEYMSANMESLLEQRMLDDLPNYLIKRLSKFISARQLEKSPFSRTDDYVAGLVAKHRDWLEGLDAPTPFVRSTKQHPPRGIGKPKTSPPVTTFTPTPTKEPPSLPSSSLRTPSTAIHRRPSGDDLFQMDLGDGKGSSGNPAQPAAATPRWKVPDAPRVDMRALMAEAVESTRATNSNLKYTADKTPQRGYSSEADQAGLSNPTGPHPMKGPSWKAPSSTPPKGGLQGTSWRQFPTLRSAATPSPPVTPARTPSNPAPPSSPLRTPGNPAQKIGLLSSPGMGPTFVPTKQPGTYVPSGNRSVSGSGSGKAWTANNPEPSATMATTSAKGISFAAIQQAQEKQVVPVKDKRTLKEIQAEEEAIQAEVDFIKWWQAEEDRVKREMAGLAKFKRGGGSSRGGQQQKAKGKGRS